MKKIVTYKYRLFPSKSQEKTLNWTVDMCRFLHNNILEYKINTYRKTKNTISKYDIHKQLPGIKEEFPEYKKVYSQVLQNVSERVDKSYQNFFRRVKQGSTKKGFPKFKGKRFYNSFTYPQIMTNPIKENNKIKLSKVGLVKIKYHRDIGNNKIKQITIRKSKTDKWYACISLEVERNIRCGSLVTGIDLGIDKFVTFSDGSFIGNPRFFKKFEKKIKKAQRRLNKTKKGSLRRKKVLRSLARLFEKYANVKNDFFHKTVNKLISKYKKIVLEALNIKSMLEDGFRRLHKSIGETSWDQFVQILTYKAEFAGCEIVKVNPKNTSQKCSSCGKIVKKTLSERTHSCSCGLVLDRDHNAAINILGLGLQALSKSLEAQEL